MVEDASDVAYLIWAGIGLYKDRTMEKGGSYLVLNNVYNWS